MIEMSLPVRLRVLRAERKLSLREVTEQTGIQKATLSKLENGLAHPRDRTLAKLAEFYGVPLTELMQEEESTAPLGKAPSEPGLLPDEAREMRRVFIESCSQYAQARARFYDQRLGETDSAADVLALF